MSRFALLLTLSLGLLVACDSAPPTSPDATPSLVVASEVTETAVFDVQPLGWLDSAVINVAAGQPITVAVLDVPDLFTLADPESIAFFGAAPLHLDRILANPLCHITSVDVLALGEDGLPYVVETVDANVLHFDLDLSAYGDGDVVPMCLTGSFLELDGDGAPVPFPESWCADVTVKNRGGGSGR